MKRSTMAVGVLAMLMFMAACDMRSRNTAASGAARPGLQSDGSTKARADKAAQVSPGKNSERATEAEGASRQQAYKRLAIVCAPVAGADPAYKSLILDEVKSMAPSRLGGLEKADCLYDVEVDASSDVPMPAGATLANDYDAVAVLLYRYGGGHVVLEMHMIDTRTAAEIWRHTLDTRDTDVKARLVRHGHWVPTTIKTWFYAFK